MKLTKDQLDRLKELLMEMVEIIDALETDKPTEQKITLTTGRA